MKKLIILIVLCLLVSSASAELDLSGYSYDHLLDLQKSITAEIISRPEWKEVTVPAGKWIIGEDIPAGAYCIKNTADSLNLIKSTSPTGDHDIYKTLGADEIIGKAPLNEGSVFSCYYAVILTPAVFLGF